MKTQILASVTGAILSFSIASAADTPPRGTIEASFEIYGTVQRSSKWESNTIRVCWENAEPSNLKLRTMVQNAIASTWEKESPVRFTEWTSCDIASKGIRILVADEGPRVEVLGRYLDTRPNGMILNFTFETVQRDCQDTIEACVTKIAIHEFGHALGLAHENNRADTPKECKAEFAGAQGDIAGDWNITKYDLYSVMNYCNKQWLGNGQLTSSDIETVRKFYGSPVQ